MRRLFIVIVCLFFVGVASANSPEATTKEHELLAQLDKVGAEQRLDLLNQLSKLSKSNPEKRKQYVSMLLRESSMLLNTRYMCEAYLYNIFMAYNMYDVESISKWMKLLESVSIKYKYYDLYFQGRKAELDMLLLSEKFEFLEQQANNMLRYAMELKSNIGISCAYQALGNVYISTFRYANAIEVLEKAYQISSKENDYMMVDEIATRLSDIFLEIKDRVNQFKYIQIIEQNVEKAMKANPQEISSYRSSLLMINIHYLNYYTDTDDLTKAAQYLEKAKEYYVDNDEYLYELYYRVALYLYYDKIGLYDKAIAEIDYLIDRPETEDVVINTMNITKAKILLNAQRYTESLNIFKATWVKKDSIQKSVIAKQIELLQKDYNSGMLLLEKEQIKRNASLVIILIIIVITCIFGCFMRKSYRIRKQLKSNECEILKMNQEVYNANVAKDKFLSNIKVAICVPLNKVVSDSLLLAKHDNELDSSSRKEISTSINETSAELMQLINNILDLSRMEAGMMKFSVNSNGLFLLLCNVMVELESRGVKIVMNVSEDNDSCLDIDIAKFRSVLQTMTSKDQDNPVEMEFSTIDDGHVLQIKVYGSKLALADQSQDIIITNEINRMLVEYFKGSYTIIHPSEIIIKLPTSPPQADSTIN